MTALCECCGESATHKLHATDSHGSEQVIDLCDLCSNEMVLMLRKARQLISMKRIIAAPRVAENAKGPKH